MTLDEAIKHCLEVAENNEQLADGKWIGAEGEANKQDCIECAKDHRQLAEWLTDLKEAKRLLKAAVEDMKDCMYYHNHCEYCALFDDNGDCPVADNDECGEKHKWRYADEALALIGEEGESNE